MHQPIPVQGKWLGQVVKGWFNYHAVPTNSRALSAFRFHVTDIWRQTLRRRSQKGDITWERITRLARDWLPQSKSSTPGRNSASSSDTRGGNRMRETRPYGSMRGRSAMSVPTTESGRQAALQPALDPAEFVSLGKLGWSAGDSRCVNAVARKGRRESRATSPNPSPARAAKPAPRRGPVSARASGRSDAGSRRAPRR
jgi:hypothetical protein